MSTLLMPISLKAFKFPFSSRIDPIHWPFPDSKQQKCNKSWRIDKFNSSYSNGLMVSKSSVLCTTVISVYNIYNICIYTLLYYTLLYYITPF